MEKGSRTIRAARHRGQIVPEPPSCDAVMALMDSGRATDVVSLTHARPSLWSRTASFPLSQTEMGAKDGLWGGGSTKPRLCVQMGICLLRALHRSQVRKGNLFLQVVGSEAAAPVLWRKAEGAGGVQHGAEKAAGSPHCSLLFFQGR